MTRPSPIAILLLLPLGLALPAAADEGQRRAPAWRGAWFVEGAPGWRHLAGPDEALLLEGRVRGADVTLRGAGDERGLCLRGVAASLAGDPPAYRERAARLEAVARRDGALDVTWTVAGEAPVHERWRRAGRAGVELVAPAPAVLEQRGGALTLDVVVRGRPMAVTLQVLAVGDARYEHLGGVVHHELLSGGAPLAPGPHRLTWDGLDRAFEPRRVLPGRYRVVVVPTDEALGPAPGDDGAGGGELELVVAPAPADASPVAERREPAAPAPSSAVAGLSGRVSPAATR